MQTKIRCPKARAELIVSDVWFELIEANKKLQKLSSGDFEAMAVVGLATLNRIADAITESSQ